MVSQRLFFALWPSTMVRDGLSALAQVSAPGEGRRHNPDDLHMTLVFLGQVTASQFQCIEKVADNIQVDPFELTINHTGFWPRPKILWAAPDHIPVQLERLVGYLNGGLRDCGFEPEQRVYKPHVTLYRKARHVTPARLATSISWQAREFVLASSTNSGSSTTRYQVLRRWALKDDSNTG
ncbi:MAG: RNA 2',3'-cyclic phosphodiesterase [Candidatus Thiodiazotropha sp. (ex Lucinoma kastoroae)]|nr:RNA 2',3'-cyclic phosphodiesterase [Candidatus Thiodiazotropha sp. (ex Lucinoma kastoroae)]MCU7861695.1 RNA 2',3'-cyclic phosphodiesterase [Candidatus Thiodiazotropha sp. (ex Lucinoma kastoroae)]